MIQSLPSTTFVESRDSRRGAAEIKFRLDADRAAAVRAWARSQLAPDPYGSGSYGDEYVTSSLYFDTSGRDVYHRRGSYGRSKYRVRRYGRGPVAFLERKLRTSGWVIKRRTTIPIDELTRLDAGESIDGFESALIHRNGNGWHDWSGRWFERRLRARDLRPVCQVTYLRTARVGATAAGPFRLTIDTQLTASPAENVALATTKTPFFDGDCILELKYRGSAPAVFRLLVERFALEARPLSKYRVALEALVGGPL